MAHTGASGQRHWKGNTADPSVCDSCREWERKHPKDPMQIAKSVADTQAAYDALPEIIEGDALALNRHVIGAAIKFRTTGGYTNPRRFGKGAVPFTPLKVVTGNMQAKNGGRHTFDEPKNGQPGEWSSIDDSKLVELCQVGFHFTDIAHLGSWTDSTSRVFVAEIDGPWMGSGDKYIARKIRLVRELDQRELLDLAERLGGERVPEVKYAEVTGSIPELAAQLWHPELITGDDPLLVELRAAAEARDDVRYKAAKKALDTEIEVIELTQQIATLRGEPTASFTVRLAELTISTTGVRASNNIDSLRLAAAKALYPDDNVAQTVEAERLDHVLNAAVAAEKLNRWLHRDQDATIARLAELGVTVANFRN